MSCFSQDNPSGQLSVVFKTVHRPGIDQQYLHVVAGFSVRLRWHSSRLPNPQILTEVRY